MDNTMQAPAITAERADVHFERKDIRFGVILALLIGIGFYLFIHLCVVWLVFGAGKRYENSIKRSPYPLANNDLNVVPPEPRLVPLDRLRNDPRGNLDEEEAQMEKTLHSAGPTADKGFVHIPIEQAMKSIVAQLPVRKQPSDNAKETGVFQVGPSNSGRALSGGVP